MAFDPNNLPPGQMIFPTPTYFDESQFFGRASDYEHVQQFLDAGSSVAISGKRRIGRSWFLQHLRSVLSPERYVVVESDELKPDTIIPRQARLFLSALIFAIQSSLRQHLPADESYSLLDPANPPVNVGQAFHRDLNKLHDHLKTINRRAVILLDEAEALLEFTDEAGIVPSVVRLLATKYQYIRVIVAGFELSLFPGNNPPLFEAFAHHQLYGIGPAGAYDLLAGQLAGYEIVFEPPELWSQVLALTGEEPALLRFLGQQLVEQARRHNGVIGAEQLAHAVEDFLATPGVGSMMNYAWTFLGANEPIQALITTLAYNNSITDVMGQQALTNKVLTQFYSGKPPDLINSDLQRLRRLGFLREHVSTGSLQFSSDLLRLWICRHRPHPGISL